MAAAFERLSPAAAEWKIDGIRIQVHRQDDEVSVFTRTLDDITPRVPEVTDAVLALGARSLVLDGEVIALREGGRPQPFQVTAGRVGSQLDVHRLRAGVPLTPSAGRRICRFVWARSPASPMFGMLEGGNVGTLPPPSAGP